MYKIMQQSLLEDHDFSVYLLNKMYKVKKYNTVRKYKMNHNDLDCHNVSKTVVVYGLN